jgi:hypothetical protein
LLVDVSLEYKDTEMIASIQHAYNVPVKVCSFGMLSISSQLALSKVEHHRDWVKVGRVRSAVGLCGLFSDHIVRVVWFLTTSVVQSPLDCG